MLEDITGTDSSISGQSEAELPASLPAELAMENGTLTEENSEREEGKGGPPPTSKGGGSSGH